MSPFELFFVLVVSTLSCALGATQEWTWVSGSTLLAQSGVYGTKLVPHADNVPGSRNRTSGVTYNDVLYLFAGYGYDGSGSEGYLNDMWVYDPYWDFGPG